jgi:hypothetical protein
MHLTIDNNNGLGGVDYTSALLRDRPLTITRRRGAWARCHGGLDALGAGLPVPASSARVTVTDAAGEVLFSGFAQADASPSAALASTAGIEEMPVFTAIEQAWLTQAAPTDALQPSTAAIHSVDADSVNLVFTTAASAALQDLATDVTLTGESEAAAYVSELFRGDGTTTVFQLAHPPFRESGNTTLISDSFDDAAWNTATWMRVDPGGRITLGSNGLHLAGGTGADGAIVLQFAQPVEMGGTLLAEATAVSLSTGSDGILLGFYSGTVSHAACVAGVRVVGTAGAHTLVALVNGVEQATSYTFIDGHSYTLRVRLHCPEVQRVLATYQANVDGGLQAFGGGTVDAPLSVVIEVRDLGLASSTLPTVLFAGGMSASPAQCIFAPVNSTELVGSVGGVTLQQQGSAWVSTTAADGTTMVQREGPAGTGADYALASTGVVIFDAGREPQPGALITVTYRRERRAVARLIDAAANAQQSALGLPGLPSWSGHVLRPKARSSADCNAAVQALLALADGAATAFTGHAEWSRRDAIAVDVNVGDTLAVQTSGRTQMLPVQAVTITDGNCLPELLRYRADFAQGRADGLSFTVSDGTAADLPGAAAVTSFASGLPPSLSALQIISATAASLQIDGGADPAAGGGFEVRRSDANFGSAGTEDLVLTVPVRGFSIPRVAFRERFFIRMFDGSTPRRYSPVSSVVLTNLPLS